MIKAQEFYEKVPNGFQIIYHENGEVIDSGYFRMGLAHGVRCIYDKEGKMRKKYRYYNDSLKELTTYDNYENVSTYEFFQFGTERIGMIVLDPKGNIVEHYGKFANITHLNLLGDVMQIGAEMACPIGFKRSVKLFTVPNWQSVPFTLHFSDRNDCSTPLIVLPKIKQKSQYGLIVYLENKGQVSSDTLIFDDR